MDTKELFKYTLKELEVTKEERLDDFRKKVDSFLEKVIRKNFSFLQEYDFKLYLNVTPKSLFEKGIYLITLGITNYSKTLHTLIFTDEQNIKVWENTVYLIPTELLYRRPEDNISVKQIREAIHPMSLQSFIKHLAEQYHNYQLYISEKK